MAISFESDKLRRDRAGHRALVWPPMEAASAQAQGSPGASAARALDEFDCTTLTSSYGLVELINRTEFASEQSRQFELAAVLMCERHDARSPDGWSGRFMPMFTQTDSAGAVEHWARRSESTPSVYLRARYADLVWEFGYLCGMRSRGQFAMRAYDAYMEIGMPGSGFRAHVRQSVLARALELARSLNDAARRKNAANRIAEEGTSTVEDQPFWAAQLLVEHEEARLVARETNDRLVASMLSQIGVARASDQMLFPALLLEWMNRVVAYRRARGGGTADSQCDVRELAADILAAVPRMNGFIAMDALHKLHLLATSVGLDRELGRIDAAIRDAGIRSGDGMVPVSFPFEIPEAEVNRFLDWAISDDLATSFARVVTGPLPTQKSVDAAAKNSMGQIESLVTHTTLTDDCRPGSVGASGEVGDMRLRRGRGLCLAMARIFTQLGLRRLADRDRHWTRSLAQLLHGLAPDTMGDPQTNLAVALAFRHKNWPVTTTLLVLRIEPLLLELACARGVRWLKSNSSGGLNVASLDGLIADEKMRAAMGERLAILIDHVFEPQGLRHSVAHGQRRDGQFTEDDAITALQAVVGLGIALARAAAARPSSGDA